MTKDYVKDYVHVNDITYVPARDAIEALQKQVDWQESQGWINLQYEQPGYDLFLSGERPMTAAELETAERKRKAAKRAAATRKQKVEKIQRQQYEKLKKKFG